LFNYPEKTLRKVPDLIIVTAMFCNFSKFKTKEIWIDFVLNTVKMFPPSTKVIIVDSEDQNGASYPNLSEREYDAVFKRELFSLPYSNWYGINFSAVPEPSRFISYDQRKYDVSFIATISNPYRTAVKDYLLEKAAKLKLSIYVHVDRTPISRAEYLDVLSQSRTAISVSGAGKDCYRYWEIPAKGAVMVAEHTGLCIPNDYTDEHIFRFKDLEELGRVLERIKNISAESLEKMALNSIEYTHMYHSPIKRAEYILKKLYERKDSLNVFIS
jgi:hypothetical protein